jgi:hypothetical protein
LAFEITPEPTPEERDALLRALASQNGTREGPSRWWEAGIREAVELEAEEYEAPDQARARPRRSAGASRA